MGCHSTEKVENEKVIVSVGDGNLTLQKLVEAVPASMKSKISKEQINNYIQQWIEMELIYREALRSGLDKDEKVLKALEDAKKEILVRRYLDEHLSDEKEVTEAEALDYYNENKDSYELEDDEVRALHILVATSEEAQAAYRRINNGEDFEKVAHEVSIDFEENNRIDLGYIKKEEIVPELSARVFSSKVGSVTRPLQSDFGYHIFKILDRKQKGSYEDFEGVKGQIISRLKSIKRNEQYTDLILGLRNKTNYKVDVEPLKEFFKDSTFQVSNEITNQLN
jgi:peptidyl-prolyl cis-trans isomerase C